MFFQSKNITFGLDIGSASIKLAKCKLIKNFKGHKSLVLTSLNETPLPEGIIVGGEIKNPPAVITAIKQCTKIVGGQFISTKTAITSLPEAKCYFKLIKAAQKTVNNNLYGDACKLADKHFPIDANEFYCEWKTINKNSIAIGAAPKNIVDSYTNVVEQANLIPLSLEIESTATARALMEKNKYTKIPKIVLDLGASSSSIIVSSHNGPLLVLNIPLSGKMMTGEIARVQKTSFEKAEKIKLNCGFDITKCPKDTKKIIVSLIDSSATQIEIGLRYINKFLKYKPSKIYICGGVSLMSKLGNTLSERLKIKVRHANPLTNVSLSKKIKISNQELLKYTTAIGLAIKGTENNSNT